jgi:hypothetical protein
MQSVRADRSTLHVARRRRVVIIGVLGFVTGCSDTTAPKTTDITPPPTEIPVPAAMVTVAGELDDMTQWWMSSIENQSELAKLQQTLTGLKAHLSAGNVVLCQQDITDTRGALAKLSEAQQVETAPIGVALDVVQSTLDGLSK